MKDKKTLNIIYIHIRLIPPWKGYPKCTHRPNILGRAMKIKKLLATPDPDAPCSAIKKQIMYNLGSLVPYSWTHILRLRMTASQERYTKIVFALNCFTRTRLHRLWKLYLTIVRANEAKQRMINFGLSHKSDRKFSRFLSIDFLINPK